MTSLDALRSAPAALPAATATCGDLRRLDWRFLLPDAGAPFEHLVLLGGPKETAADLLKVGAARRVSRALPAGRDADALVVLAGSRVSPAEAAAALAPAGVLWWEVDRRSRGQRAATPARVCAELRRAGMGGVTAYWAKGGHESCSMYLPLASDEALRWYFSSLFRAGTRIRHVARAAAHLLTAWRGSRFGSLVPCFGILATADQADGAVPAVLARREWPGGTDPTHAVLLLGGQGEWSRVTLLPFAASGANPGAVVKLPRTSRYNGATHREQVVLTALHREPAVEADPRFPAPLGSFRWRGLTVAAESYVSGHPLGGPGRTAAPGEELRLGAEWLLRFHAGSSFPRRALGTEARRLVHEPAEAYARTFGPTGAETRLLDRWRATADRLAGESLPWVWEHRDFGPWNLRRNDDGLAVIDWEVAREGPPLSDLLYFAMHLRSARRGRTSASLRMRELHSLFVVPDMEDPFVAEVWVQIGAYMERLALSPSLLPVLLVHMLVCQALDRHERIALGGRREPRGDNPYVGYIGDLAVNAGTLFARRDLPFTPASAPSRLWRSGDASPRA